MQGEGIGLCSYRAVGGAEVKVCVQTGPMAGPPVLQFTAFSRNPLSKHLITRHCTSLGPQQNTRQCSACSLPVQNVTLNTAVPRVLSNTPASAVPVQTVWNDRLVSAVAAFHILENNSSKLQWGERLFRRSKDMHADRHTETHLIKDRR